MPKMWSEAMTDLILRLNQGLMASCVCGTKTPVFGYHDPLCKYRLLSEAIEEIDKLEHQVARLKKMVDT